jgi:hypothetical protein
MAAGARGCGKTGRMVRPVKECLALQQPSPPMGPGTLPSCNLAFKRHEARRLPSRFNCYLSATARSIIAHAQSFISRCSKVPAQYTCLTSCLPDVRPCKRKPSADIPSRLGAFYLRSRRFPWHENEASGDTAAAEAPPVYLPIGNDACRFRVERRSGGGMFDEPNDRFGVAIARRALDEITRSVLLGRMNLVQVRAGAAVSLMESTRLIARTDQLLARKWCRTEGPPQWAAPSGP